MKIPRISVLMPAYNSEKYIAEAIESILNQTFTDFELVILNDSPDNTELENIIKKYVKHDKRIKYIKNNKNMGLAYSRNKLLDVASGEYVAWMDSDDISLPDRLAKQVEYMDKYLECGVLSGAFHMFGAKDQIVTHPQYVGILDLLYGCVVANPAAMVRKSILDTHGFRYDANYIIAEDFELWSRMVFVTEIHNLPDVLLKYRWSGTNISVSQADKQHELNNRIKQNILNKLTADKHKQCIVQDCAANRIKTGILLPKWLGRIVALFIFIPSARRNFRNKYVKS